MSDFSCNGCMILHGVTAWDLNAKDASHVTFKMQFQMHTTRL